jgi:uncharacterized membrane protein
VSFFFLMLVIFATLHLPFLGNAAFLSGRKDKAAVAMGAAFAITGAMHFSNPARFLPMMPAWLPWRLELIYLSGAFEILGGSGLAVRRTRRAAALGLTGLLLAIFPANIHVALSGGSVEGLASAGWYYWVRLPFQFAYIAWALWCSGPHGSRAYRPATKV